MAETRPSPSSSSMARITASFEGLGACEPFISPKRFRLPNGRLISRSEKRTLFKCGVFSTASHALQCTLDG